jgi:hypothetical protein
MCKKEISHCDNYNIICRCLECERFFRISAATSCVIRIEVLAILISTIVLFLIMSVSAICYWRIRNRKLNIILPTDPKNSQTDPKGTLALTSESKNPRDAPTSNSNHFPATRKYFSVPTETLEPLKTPIKSAANLPQMPFGNYHHRP